MVDDFGLRVLVLNDVYLGHAASKQVVVQELLEAYLLHGLLRRRIVVATGQRQQQRDEAIRLRLVVLVKEEAFRR